MMTLFNFLFVASNTKMINENRNPKICITKVIDSQNHCPRLSFRILNIICKQNIRFAELPNIEKTKQIIWVMLVYVRTSFTLSEKSVRHKEV
jgi:hypothetical protein